jgi:hypothetical protein
MLPDDDFICRPTFDLRVGQVAEQLAEFDRIAKHWDERRSIANSAALSCVGSRWRHGSSASSYGAATDESHPRVRSASGLHAADVKRSRLNMRGQAIGSGCEPQCGMPYASVLSLRLHVVPRARRTHAGAVEGVLCRWSASIDGRSPSICRPSAGERGSAVELWGTQCRSTKWPMQPAPSAVN